MLFVRPVMPCLLVVYGAEPGRGRSAETEPLLIMRPPCGAWSRMRANEACATRKAAVRLVSITLDHAASPSSPKLVDGTLTPALLNVTSTLPYSRLIAPNSELTCFSSVRSAGQQKASTPPPAALQLAAVSSSGAARRPVSTTAPRMLGRSQPVLDARRRHTARPIPVPAPVTRATVHSAGASRGRLREGASLGTSWTPGASAEGKSSQ
mmetsp:Transcript_17254/g.51647  ORF Transcript_17254/g.51647 Transcript_17254/m.51647 type:complete len:209 (+) Transcript_17254:679-1305(+)